MNATGDACRPFRVGSGSAVPKSEGHVGELWGKLAEVGGAGKYRAQTAGLREGVIPGGDELLRVVLGHPLLCTQVSGSPSFGDRDGQGTGERVRAEPPDSLVRLEQ